MVEVDRGTMPVTRADLSQSSFERKMRAYLTAYAGNEHLRRFGWKSFRVLVVTTNQHRMQSMIEALRQINVTHAPGGALFFFAKCDELRATDALTHRWQDGSGQEVRLV
jgi:hypothetical protein